MKRKLFFILLLLPLLSVSQSYYGPCLSKSPPKLDIRPPIMELFTQRIYVTFVIPSDWPTWISMSSDGETAIPNRIDWGDGEIVEYNELTVTKTLSAGTHHVVISYQTCLLPNFQMSSLWAVEVDTHDAPTLDYLDVNTCPRLTSLITTGTTALTYLNVSRDTSLNSVNLSSNVNLHDFYAAKSGLTGIDMNDHPAINILFLDSCQKLTSVRSSDNVVSTITCKGCNHLLYIYANNANLEALTVTGCTALYFIQIFNNPTLSSLDVSGAGALSNLYVTGSGLNEEEITSLISTMKNRSSISAGSCNLVPQSAGFPSTLTTDQQNALTAKHWTEL